MINFIRKLLGLKPRITEKDSIEDFMQSDWKDRKMTDKENELRAVIAELEAQVKRGEEMREVLAKQLVVQGKPYAWTMSGERRWQITYDPDCAEFMELMIVACEAPVYRQNKLLTTQSWHQKHSREQTQNDEY